MVAAVSGEGGGWLLDVVHAAFGAGAVVAVVRIQGQEAAGWLAAAAVLPIAAFAEVDLPWIALLLAGLAGSGGWTAMCVALAVSVSPVALLAVPWAACRGQPRWVVGGASLAVVTLSAYSGGDWWLGDRGVLMGPAPLIGRTLAAWAANVAPVAVAVGVLGMSWRTALLLPLLLAPPDVATWGLIGCALVAEGPARPWSLGLRVLVAGQLGLSTGALVATHRSVRADTRLVEKTAADMGPDEGLIAPWTWGVRVSLAATGDPYGLPWMPPTGPVRDQERWCDDPPSSHRALHAADDLAWCAHRTRVEP